MIVIEDEHPTVQKRHNSWVPTVPGAIATTDLTVMYPCEIEEARHSAHHYIGRRAPAIIH